MSIWAHSNFGHFCQPGFLQKRHIVLKRFKIDKKKSYIEKKKTENKLTLHFSKD